MENSKHNLFAFYMFYDKLILIIIIYSYEKNNVSNTFTIYYKYFIC